MSKSILPVDHPMMILKPANLGLMNNMKTQTPKCSKCGTVDDFRAVVPTNVYYILAYFEGDEVALAESREEIPSIEDSLFTCRKCEHQFDYEEFLRLDRITTFPVSKKSDEFFE